MNVEFTWETEFDATIVLDSEILPNKYHIIIGMVTNTSDQTDQVQAFEKIKFFLKEWLQHSCFTEHDTPASNILIEHFDQKIVQLPVQASDLIIGAALFSKLHAIADNYLIIDFVQIQSDLGSNVMYSIDGEDTFAELNNPSWTTTPWWNRSDLSTNDLENNNPIGWADLDLETTKDKINKQKFCPTIINGGKHEPHPQR
jgi:hypothetical protein